MEIVNTKGERRWVEARSVASACLLSLENSWATSKEVLGGDDDDSENDDTGPDGGGKVVREVVWMDRLCEK